MTALAHRLRDWWNESREHLNLPWDADSGAFATSLLLHFGILLALGLVPLLLPQTRPHLTILSPLAEEEVDVKIPEEVYFSDEQSEQIGANSADEEGMALSLAPVVAELSEIPSATQLTPVEEAEIELNQSIEVATGLHLDQNLIVKGAAGEGTTGALGAIDRLTNEILHSLEQRKTLVVWLFDQSASLSRQREEIHGRLHRIYEELGLLEQAENPAFKRHRDKPLLTSVFAFGKSVQMITGKPTDDIDEIKQAVDSIELDNSGVENVFAAVGQAAGRFKELRIPKGKPAEPERNVLIVVVTDEAGDDRNGLGQSVALCRRYSMPVYVVGVPAPFGRQETLVKWVDPDKKYDQTPGWGRVNQGPESLFPERIKLNFSASAARETPPIDSGFGPFALTRLAYETGGIYFAVHPNRSTTRKIRRRDTSAFAAHLQHFFDPEVMRKYRPDYVTVEEYMQRLNQNKARTALFEASRQSWLTPMEIPQFRFVKRDEASFANALTEAQKAAAKLSPKISALHSLLQVGETDREQEASPRWQAGYDLAIGRVLAVRVRTESFNAMLAKAKRGMKFTTKKNNTWILKPSGEVSVGSQLKKQAANATQYLQRVVDKHPGTPWALLASRELEDPMSWKWVEEFTNLNPPARRGAGGGGGNPGPAQDDRKKMLKKPPPKRAIPKL